MSKNVLRIATVGDLPEHLRAQVLAKLSDMQVHLVDAGPAPRMLVPEIYADIERIERLIIPTDPVHPSEHKEQKSFFDQLEDLAMRDARYRIAVKRTHAIANGGSGRTKAEGGRLKVTGVRPGVSDILVALPVGRLAGLYIEMKSMVGDPNPKQRTWLNDSLDLGYASACCRGARQALIVWHAYVDPSL